MILGFSILIELLVGFAGLICILVAAISIITWIIYLFIKRKRSKSAEIAAGTSILLFIFLFGFSRIAFGPNHPSDDELIKNYTEKKERFHQLVRRIQENEGIERIDDNWTRPNDLESIGISNSELKEYRRIFKELGIPRGFYRYDSGKILFMSSTYGLSVTGSTKGYYYSESEPQPIVDSTDDYWSEDGRSFICYRKIDENWYIYFDYED